ncbi:MAG: bifunctional 3-(3-hydroxy-phenyl)propionate/3-hydroxycinnamic acid hydroxylase [Burkholderiaceae bacterium]
MTTIDTDVALVGYGPVAAVLSNLLARQGLRVMAFEREAAIYALPRAIALDAECMRVMQMIGLADALEAQMAVGKGMRFVNAGGELLIEWSRPPGIGPQGWHPSYRYHQPTLEATLGGQALSTGLVRVLRQHDVVAIDPEPEHVALRFEDLNSGKSGQARARWVIGCDGARSTVRRVMGSGLEDLQSHERWLVIDVILKRDRPDLGDWSIQYCDPARPATYVRGVGARRRWEIMLLPGEDAAVLTRPEALWSLLSRWITPDDAELERPAVYTFHSVVARGWRQGRLLIAGDAAHQTPPFMGQGLCAGIRDAANLAWKLARVHQGLSSPALLETYESERSPHVREFIEATLSLGRVIQERDPQAAAERDARWREQPMKFAAPQPALGPGLHRQDSQGGRLSEQPLLADGTRMDDRIGPRFGLLRRPGLAADPVAAGWAADTLAVINADSDSAIDWLDRLGADAALLRPDRYLLGVAQGGQGLERLLQDGLAIIGR